MQRLSQPTTTPPVLLSMETQGATLQLAASSRGVVLDLYATNFDTEGHPRTSSAITKMCLDEAMRFHALLETAIDAAWDADDPLTERTDPRQTALWSNASFTQPHRRAA